MISPADLPVTVDECKRDLRMTASDQDALIQDLIVAAVDYCDGSFGLLNRALITQTWKMVVPELKSCFEIPLTPVVSISSASYYDESNDLQSYDPANYIVTGDNDRAMIDLAGTATLPGTYDRPDAVSITFVAGYGAAGDVPSSIRMAIRLLVSHWFESPIDANGGMAMPAAVEALLSNYKRGFVG